jgi:hypothetical protein
MLPYFPASNRTFISYLLYFLELRHLLTAFQEEQEVLRSAPDEPDFPDQDTLLHIMTDQMPQSDAKRVQNMMEIHPHRNLHRLRRPNRVFGKKWTNHGISPLHPLSSTMIC